MSLAMIVFGGILLAFHLVLLLKWEKVRRVSFYMLGCGGLAVMFLGNFFLIGGNSRVMLVAELFHCLGLLAALAGAIGACFPGDLPVMPSAPRNQRPQGPVSIEKM